MRVDASWIASTNKAIEYLVKEYEYYREKGKELSPQQVRQQEQWQGLLADRLGFNEGPKSGKDRYIAIMLNEHPVTEERLTARQNTTRKEIGEVWSDERQHLTRAEVEVSNRRPAAEVGFSFRKSFSAYLALSGDEAFREDLHRIVEAKLRDRIEPLLGCRVRKGGVEEFRFTGNGAYRVFWHKEARPVYGHPDPQEHAHVVFANATFDPVEAKVKALDLTELYKGLPLIQAECDAEVARLAESRGHGLRRTDNGYEMAVLTQKEIETFSKRTDQLRQIEKRENRDINRQVEAKAREARRKGLTFDEKTARDEVRAGLARDYRSPKHAAKFSGPALEANWKAQLEPGREAQITPEGSRSTQSKGLLSAEEAKVQAIAECFECHSVVTERDLKVKALTLGVGRVSPQDAERFAKEDPRLIRAQDGRVTTHEIYAEEAAIRAKAAATRGELKPLVAERWAFVDQELDVGQRAAVSLLLQSRDRVNGIEGLAGSGKTRSFAELARAVEQTTGNRPFFIACTGRAAEKSAELSGSVDPITVSRFLVDRRLHEGAAGRLVVVDEASVLDNATMMALMDLAQAHDFRLALVGDPNQQKPIKRGDEFARLIQSEALQTARLDVIYRQRMNPLLLELVTEWQTGDKAHAWDRFEAEGMIKECDSYTDALEQATDHFVAVRRLQSHDVMALALRHADGQAFAERLRPKLQDAGLLGPEGLQVRTLNSLQLLEAEKADAVHYRPGHVVQFHRPAKGFKSGDRCEVSRVENGQVMVTKGGRERELPLAKCGSFQVYERGELAIAEGEQVIATQKIPEAHFKAGQVKTVRSVSAQKLTFTDGSTLELTRPVSLRQGWTQTALPAQGAEANTVLPFIPFEALAALSPEAATVLLTRAKQELRLYTNSAEMVRFRALAPSDRQSAHEIVHANGKPSTPDLQEHAIRTPAEFPVERQMSDHEKNLWAKAAVKYPVETRTPELQARIERTIERMLQDPDRQKKAKAAKQHTHEWHPGINTPGREQGRGYEGSL
jgi:conjugative relaxase-like TrwC/TraI family protein